MKRALQFGFIFLNFLFVFGCVSQVVPPAARSQVNRSISFEKLVQSPGRYVGEWVVFGGVILSSRNRKRGTEIEIMQKPLTRSDEPEESDESKGRFIAFYRGYLETSVYKKDRSVTVFGEVTGQERRLIGEMFYTYPVVTIRKIRLWPDRDQFYYPPYWYIPYGYDGYYYPWLGYGYPYRYSPYWP